MKKHFYSILSAAAILLIIFVWARSGKEITQPITYSPNLTIHPVYSLYKFDNSEKVINIGTQPLYIPTGLITETMKRDIILKKAMKEEGVEVRFYPFLKGHDVNFFLRKGDLDAGIGGDMPAISIASDMDIVIPALVQQGFISIVANHHMMIDELRGKRIGYAYGSISHYSLLNILSSEGLDESTVSLIHMEVLEMPQAMFNEKVDAFSAWEPIPSIALTKYPDSVVTHRSLSSGYIYFNKTLNDNHPELTRLILASELRALHWLRENKNNLLSASKWTIAAGKKLTGKNMAVSAEKITNLSLNDIVGSAFPPIVPESDLTPSGRIYKEYTFLRDIDKIPHSNNWWKVRDSFDISILEAVIANSRTYRLHEFSYDVQRGGDE